MSDQVTMTAAAHRLGVSVQAISKMVSDGNLVPTGPGGTLTAADIAALEWAHKARETFGFKLDQLRPFARLVQRRDTETQRRCVFALRRINETTRKWTLEVFSTPMPEGGEELRRKVAEAEGSDPDAIELAFNLEKFARDTFGRKLRETERAIAKAARSLARARSRR